jgi:CheY-like chemotaxis protein
MTSRRVLIVDDDYAIRDALADFLVHLGYEVALAADGCEALAYLRTHPPPCLVLLDWMMPKCDGRTFRDEQRRDPTIAHVPVALLTADMRLSTMAAEQGLPYLRKPVVVQELIELLERHARGAA